MVGFSGQKHEFCFLKKMFFFEHEVLLELFLFFFNREIMLFSRENFGFQMIDFRRSQMISEIE